MGFNFFREVSSASLFLTLWRKKSRHFHAILNSKTLTDARGCEK
jgi:hypothetical protein